MARSFALLLEEIEGWLDRGPDNEAALEILKLMGIGRFEPYWLDEGRLYCETLPMGREPALPHGHRVMQFLWEALDRAPLGLMINFAVPLRRMLATRIFGACGTGFFCEEEVRFNFARTLFVGDNVFINRGAFLDTKGGLRIGDSAGIAEFVRIFTHSHSEASHIDRAYREVVVGARAKVYSGAVIMPGVTIGEEAIVAANALVNKDVPPGMVVAGTPAKVIRERRSEGRSGDDLDHIWLF